MTGKYVTVTLKEDVPMTPEMEAWIGEFQTKLNEYLEQHYLNITCFGESDLSEVSEKLNREVDKMTRRKRQI